MGVFIFQCDVGRFFSITSQFQETTPFEPVNLNSPFKTLPADINSDCSRSKAFPILLSVSAACSSSGRLEVQVRCESIFSIRDNFQQDQNAERSQPTLHRIIDRGNSLSFPASFSRMANLDSSAYIRVENGWFGVNKIKRGLKPRCLAKTYHAAQYAHLKLTCRTSFAL